MYSWRICSYKKWGRMRRVRVCVFDRRSEGGWVDATVIWGWSIEQLPKPVARGKEGQVGDYKIQFRAIEGVDLLYNMPLSCIPRFTRRHKQTYFHMFSKICCRIFSLYVFVIISSKTSLFVSAAGLSRAPDAANNTLLIGVCVAYVWLCFRMCDREESLG